MPTSRHLQLVPPDHVAADVGRVAPSRSWRIAVDENAPALARLHVFHVLSAGSVDSDAIADAVIMTSELVANVVAHTRVRSLELTVSLADDEVSVDVVEGSPSETPGPGLTGPVQAATVGSGGRGLAILDSLAGSWGVSRSHRATTTWFTLAGSRPAVVAARPDALVASLQAAVTRSQLLLRITEALSRARTPAEIGDAVTSLLRGHLAAVFVGIALRDGDAPTMTYLSLDPLPAPVGRTWSTFPLDRSAPVGAAALDGYPYFHESVAAAESAFPGLAAHMTDAGAAALAHLPLTVADATLGTLAVAWTEAHPIDPDVRALLTIVAGYVAHAVRRT